MYVLGSQGEVKFANDAWCKIFGFVPGTAVTKAWLPRAHPDDVEELERQWKRCLQGIPGDRITWRVLRPGSTSFDTEDDIIYLEACDFPELAEDGTLQSICGVVMDMSVYKAYEREQAERLKNALEAKRAQEYFMGKWCFSWVSRDIVFGLWLTKQRYGQSRNAQSAECHYTMCTRDFGIDRKTDIQDKCQARDGCCLG